MDAHPPYTRTQTPPIPRTHTNTPTPTSSLKHTLLKPPPHTQELSSFSPKLRLHGRLLQPTAVTQETQKSHERVKSSYTHLCLNTNILGSY
jgi:hypothetical protein